jgi:CMP-N,N'-diacetyllegionaminic acid synthase
LNGHRAATLALVPARGGSKSIPRKNLATLAGKPLLSWTIEAALRSSAAPRVVVSTEDDEIAEIARGLGADVPFRRPRALARDETPSLPVTIHALRWLADNERYSPQRVLLLQPTSPLRTADDIDAAIDIAEKHDGAGVVSVSPSAQHPYLAKRVTDDGLLEDFAEHPRLDRRQDLMPAFALNGAIYLTPAQWLVSHESFYAEKTYAYVMPVERSIDVDEPWDLHLCELILRDRLARD